MTGYVRAGCNDAKALGTGLSAPVNYIHLTIRVEATIWE